MDSKLLNSIIISIDGLDGTGKTPISKYLENKLQNSVEIKRIIGVPDKYVDKLAYNSFSIDTQYLYYLASFVDSMMKATKKHTVVLLDRSYYSTMAYHTAYGCKIEVSNIFNAFRKPDLSLYLSTDAKTITSRLQKRDELDWYEKQLIKETALGLRIESIYESFGLQKIDSTNIDEAKVQTLDIVRQYLKTANQLR
ncbi:dTMP kinase [Maridesulfovibrio sp.]|uniref:dTMP kinase n=1 Tax=Maridesulfovibrio sp. TaxID=2795000 RepID=UPI003BABDEF6